MKVRIESDTMGDVEVPAGCYWGAQTQRSLNNFKIGDDLMPIEVIYSLSIIKKASAMANFELDILPQEKMNIISQVCDEILEGRLDEEFPLRVWQTGSGTHTNMNINEVISNRGHVLLENKLGEGEKLLSPNDDVNMSQSSNDTFSAAMNISAYKFLVEKTIPSIEVMKSALENKSVEFRDEIKIGRTHFMDATPLTLGQEISGYAAQLEFGLSTLKRSLVHLSELALGGTAVGTGLNTPKGYSELVAKKVAMLTNLPFREAPNKFETLAAHDAIVESHAALKQLAVSLMKIANDIRMLGSGPRAGIGELILPTNEPGSSIMPGKVNPSQCEALTMVCSQVMGNDLTISIAGMSGQFELNTYKPVIIYNFLSSARLLADACLSFYKNCILGMRINHKKIQENLNNSLMLVTALNTKIGYYKASEIANAAYENNTTLKEEAIRLGYVSAEEFDEWVNPKDMI